MLLVWLGVLFVAGGSGYADVPGQTIVQGVGWTLMSALALFAKRPWKGATRPIWVMLACAWLLVLVQLVPLPPAVWASLPGRALFAHSALVNDVWRPWSLVPGATINAASSLVVPTVTLLLLTQMAKREWQRLPAAVLVLICLSSLMGLVQLSSGGLINPLVNGSAGQVSGSFANRNHFALFLAMGCAIAPVWASAGYDRLAWRVPAALGLIAFLTLMILASGSRTGLFLGGLGIIFGLLIARRLIVRAARRLPAAMSRLLWPAGIGIAGLLIGASIWAGRAPSIARLLANNPGEGMRAKALPTVLRMAGEFFPFGAGYGSFSVDFQMHEPVSLLKPTLFMHAHNDLLEVLVDGGLPAAGLLVAALVWFSRETWLAWRRPVPDADTRMSTSLARLGSALLLLILGSSLFDYPARTPMMMALIVLAAGWICRGRAERDRPGLPTPGEHL